MREISQFTRKDDKPLNIIPDKNVKEIINLIDKLIAGKRFGELDSAKQMYLLDCQCKLSEMQEGNFTEESINFLLRAMDSLKEKIILAENTLLHELKIEELKKEK